MSARFLVLWLAAVLAAACGRGDRPDRVRIGVMPKLVGIDYFNACERGAREAGEELGVEVVYDGPITNDVTRQAEMIDTWIAQRFDAIAVAPNDPHALAPTLRRAAERGIAVLTWDADSEVDSRRCFVNQATYEDIGYALVDILARQTGGAGQVAIITGSLTAANQNIWMEWMTRRLASQYPAMQVVAVKPSEEDQQLAFQVSQDLLKAYPDLAGIFAITSVALPGAAEALRQSGAAGQVALTGLATPNSMRQYVKDGTVQSVLLWNPVDLGYLTVQAAARLVRDGALPPELAAGRLGPIRVRDGEVLLGPPLEFSRGNIDDFDF
ncbi:MAG: substrate-binding domain-containing protein [Gemmatimonadota bacterium]